LPYPTKIPLRSYYRSTKRASTKTLGQISTQAFDGSPGVVEVALIRYLFIFSLAFQGQELEKINRKLEIIKEDLIK